MRELSTLTSILNLALGLRGKRHRRAASFLTGGARPFLNTSTLLGAAGLAVGMYETYRERRGTPNAPAPVEPGLTEVRADDLGTPAQPLPDAAPTERTAAPSLRAEPPLGATTSAAGHDLSAPLLRLVRLTVAAARADGALSAAERERCLAEARAGGVEHVMRAELERVHPLAEIVAGVTAPAQQRDLYTLAYCVVRADEGVNGAERIFLAQLAARLDLDPAAVAALERDADARIDAQPQA
jgi:uncharacterized membrane protein YebE (DUF533 family)